MSNAENLLYRGKGHHIKQSDLKQVTLRQNQKLYRTAILENEVTFCSGPAGTSKTFTMCYTALELLFQEKIKKIVLVKPIREAGESLGYLPGDIHEKIDPYFESYRHNFESIIGEPKLKHLIKEGFIEFKPLAYMRGVTYEDSIMLLDEAQNSDFRQLMLFITRMGKSSKVTIAGDVSQFDIDSNKVALPKFIKLVEDVKGVAVIRFGDKDIVRNPILKEIVNRYEHYKAYRND